MNGRQMVFPSESNGAYSEWYFKGNTPFGTPKCRKAIENLPSLSLLILPFVGVNKCVLYSTVTLIQSELMPKEIGYAFA